MPRSSIHDRADSIERAMEIFWERGYHATSMKDLECGLDMRPGSIYAAFGSKAGLFLAALERYAEALGEEFALVMDSARSPVAGIEAYLRNVAHACGTAGQTDGWPIPGCMLVKTILEAGQDNAEVRASAEQLLAAVEDRLTELVKAAQAAGELREDAAPRRLARLLQAQIMGLRAFAQRTVDAQDVQQLAEDMSSVLDRYRVNPATTPATPVA